MTHYTSIVAGPMIPRIRRIYIQNFRSIDRTVVDLEPLTVLVGPNGAGKSNFVAAMDAVGRYITEGLDANAHYLSVPRWHSSAKGIPLFGASFELEVAPDTMATYSFLLKGSDYPSTPSVMLERCSVIKAGIEIGGFEVEEGRFVREIAGIRPQIAADRLAIFAASAVPEFRPTYDLLTSIRTYSIRPQEIVDYVGPNSPSDSLETSGRNSVAVLRAIRESAPEDHARIERVMAQAVAGVTGVTTRFSQDRQWLQFTKDFGANEPSWLIGGQMSDGTLRLLGLLLTVYQPRRPAVLIVEEPEATVHPAIAKLVMQVFRDASRRQQVILTTHSPDLLDAKELSDEQIRVVSQRHGRTVIAPLGRASRQAIRERLYTPGELLRLGELDDDAEGALAAPGDPGSR